MLQKFVIFLERKQRWFGLPLVVVMSLAAMAVAFVQPGFLNLVELKTLDARFQMRGIRKPDPNIVIVAVDNHSLERFGQWPWSRKKISLLLDRVLGQYGAKVVGFDIVFSESQKNPFEETIESIASTGQGKSRTITQWLQQHRNLGNVDAQFAKTLHKYQNRICMGYFFYPTGASAPANAIRDLALTERLLQPSAITARENSDARHLLTQIQAVTANIPILSRAADVSGFFNFFPGADGLVRQVPLVAELDGYYYPSLDLQMLRIAMGWPPLSVYLSDNGMERLQLNHIDIRTNPQGQMLLNHYGPGYTFRHVAAANVLEGKADPAIFKDAIVLLGVTATGVFDVRSSPFDTLFPGVEAHATVISNILHHQELYRPKGMFVFELLAVLLIGIGCGWFVLGRGATVQAITLIGMPLAIILLAFWMFTAYNIWIKETYLILSILMTAAPVTLAEYMIESRKRAFIHHAFSHYLAPKVVDELAQHPENLQLGGVKKEMTAMFSDIAGFSTFSESMEPEALVHFLNRYLSAMSDIILAYGGTIDKYEGDAIIAFFGAPLDIPDHAARAVLTAMEQQKTLVRLRKIWADEGLPDLHIRIGINSGPMVVGNMGTEKHMNFTIMGDDANLASRLEGVNKVYGTSILIGESTWHDVRDSIEARLIDRVYVMGRRTPVTIYAPMGKRGEIQPQDQSFSRAYEQAWITMNNRQFETAEAMFSELTTARPDDGPSSTMLLRCRRFIKKPPPDKWDGVHKLTSK